MVGAHDPRHHGRVRHQPMRVHDVIAFFAEAPGHLAAQGEGGQGGEEPRLRPHPHVGVEALRIAPPRPRRVRRIAVGEEAHGLVASPAQVGVMGQDHVHRVAAPGHRAGDRFHEGRGHVSGEFWIGGRHHQDLHASRPLKSLFRRERSARGADGTFRRERPARAAERLLDRLAADPFRRETLDDPRGAERAAFGSRKAERAASESQTGSGGTSRTRGRKP